MKNKKIVFYVTRQYMKQNKKRTITTLIGIVFMVILMTCVFVGKDTAIRYLEQVAVSKSGSWHIAAYDVNKEQYEKIKALDYVAETAVSCDLGYSEFMQSQNGDKPFLNVKGYSKDCFDWLNISLASGRYPENENELVISVKALEDGADLQIGDVVKTAGFKRKIKGINPEAKSTWFPFQNITLHYGETIEVPQDFPYYGDNASFEELHEENGVFRTYTIVGFIEAPSYETEDGSFYAAIAYIPNSMEHLEKANVSAKFDLARLEEGYIYMSDFIQGIMNDNSDAIDTNDMLLAFSANSADSGINVIVNFMVGFFMCFIMAVSIILIYNVFNISFEERSRYLGMLSSVGATKGQKRSSVYYESFFLLLIAIPIGFLAGIGIVKAGMLILQPYILKLEDSFMASAINNETVHLVITFENVLLILCASVGTVTLSAWLPARKIGKIGPIESICGNSTNKAKVYYRNEHLLRKGKPERLLAINHLHRQKHKTRSIVRAIAVFIMILTVTTYGTSGVTQMVQYRLVEDATVRTNMDGYDYVLYEASGNAGIYHALREEILQSEDVVDTKEWYCGMFAGSVKDAVLSQEYWNAYRNIAKEYGISDEQWASYRAVDSNIISVMGVDQETFEGIAKNCGCDMDLLHNSRYPAAILYQNPELSTQNIRFEDYKADHYRFYEIEKISDMNIGEDFPVSFYAAEGAQNEDINITLAGCASKEDIADYVTFHGEHIWMIVSSDTVGQWNQILGGGKAVDADGNYSAIQRQLYIKLKSADCTLAGKLQGLMQEEQDDFILSKTGDKFALKSVAETINYIIKIIAVCFVIFTAFICLLNLYNSIRGRAAARKRELAMLQSVGMTEKQMDRMLLYENLLLCVRGTIWAYVCAVPLIYGMSRVMKAYFGELRLTFSWQMYVLAIVITIVSLLLISHHCYRIRKNTNILEEMRRETV